MVPERLKLSRSEAIAYIQEVDTHRRANLALNPVTSELEIQVACERGAVRIKGKISNTSQLREIERVARKVEGVTSVNLEESAPPTGA